MEEDDAPLPNPKVSKSVKQRVREFREREREE